jgi:hypothetical protein
VFNANTAKNYCYLLEKASQSALQNEVVLTIYRIDKATAPSAHPEVNSITRDTQLDAFCSNERLAEDDRPSYPHTAASLDIASDMKKAAENRL